MPWNPNRHTTDGFLKLPRPNRNHHDWGNIANTTFCSIKKLSLEELWNEFNSNTTGDSATVIDKEEMLKMTSSVFFVEEGMTEREFYSKNAEVYEAYAYDPSKMSSSVSNLVKNIIDSGDYEKKRDVILGKLSYLDADTRKLVEQEEDNYKTRQETVKQVEASNENDEKDKIENFDGLGE